VCLCLYVCLSVMCLLFAKTAKQIEFLLGVDIPGAPLYLMGVPIPLQRKVGEWGKERCQPILPHIQGGPKSGNRSLFCLLLCQIVSDFKYSRWKELEISNNNYDDTPYHDVHQRSRFQMEVREGRFGRVKRALPPRPV